MAKEINKKKKKAKTKYDIAYICMLIVAGLIIIGTGTYAYYRSTMTGTTSGTIAKWSFTANNQASNFNLNLGKVYPGKTGTYNIELSAENSDLPVMFHVIFHFPNMVTNWDTFTYDTEKWGEGAASWAKFYFDNAYTIGFDSGGNVGLVGLLLEGEKMNIPLYYNWPYDENATNTDNDNSIQRAAGGNNTSNKITIVGRQLDKSSVANIEASMDSFVADVLDMSSCTNGEYNYPNKYGYPCGILDFTFGDVLYEGTTTDYTMADGSVTTVPKYMAQILKIDQSS